MASMRSIILGMLALLPLALAGCGGSGTNSSADPLANNAQSNTGSSTDSPSTPTGYGTVLAYTMSLTTAGSSGATTVGANST